MVIGMENKRLKIYVDVLDALFNLNEGKANELIEDNGGIVECCDLLGRAFYDGERNVILWMLNKGFDVNKGFYEDKPHYEYCTSKEVLKCMVDKGLNLNELNGVNGTILHYAVKIMRQPYVAETIKYLIDQGADLSIKDGEGHNAIYYICATWPELVADYKDDYQSIFVSLLNNRLYDAVHNLVLILDKDFIITDDINPEVIDFIIYEGHSIPLLQCLVNNNISLNVTNQYGQTPLWYDRSADILSFLVSQGVDPNHVDDYGRRAIDSYMDTSSAKTLITNGARIEDADIGRLAYRFSVAHDYYANDESYKDFCGIKQSLTELYEEHQS